MIEQDQLAVSKSRQDALSGALSLSLDQLRKAYDKGDFCRLVTVVTSLVPLFRDIGATRCYLVCERALEISQKSSNIRIIYPCLIELLVQFMLYQRIMQQEDRELSV